MRKMSCKNFTTWSFSHVRVTLQHLLFRIVGILITYFVESKCYWWIKYNWWFTFTDAQNYRHAWLTLSTYRKATWFIIIDQTIRQLKTFNNYRSFCKVHVLYRVFIKIYPQSWRWGVDYDHHGLQIRSRINCSNLTSLFAKSKKIKKYPKSSQFL
jgi:hypothetical protein